MQKPLEYIWLPAYYWKQSPSVAESGSRLATNLIISSKNQMLSEEETVVIIISTEESRKKLRCNTLVLLIIRSKAGKTKKIPTTREDLHTQYHSGKTYAHTSIELL